MKSIEVTAGPALKVGEPKLLFKVRNVVGGNTKFVSPDGQQFVFSIRQAAQ